MCCFVRFIRLFTALSVGVFTLSASAKQKPLNIVFICAEDMGREIAAYGDSTLKTPGLDRLAAEGIVFDRAYASSPTCSSSRAGMLTGFYTHQHGQYGLVGRGHRIHEGVPNVVDQLRAAGYFAGVTYKVHIDPEPEFDIGPKDTAFSNPEKLAKVAERCIQEAQKAGKPLFLLLNTFDTHALNKKVAYKINNMWRDRYQGHPAETLKPGEAPLWNVFQDGDATPAMKEHAAAYYNSLKRVDMTVEKTLALLDKYGMNENTLVIFSADHGPAYPRGKQTLYESGIRVPFIVRWPDQRNAGERSEALISLIDLMPTFLEAANLDIPDYLPSQSIMELGANPQAPFRKTVGADFFSHWAPEGFHPGYMITDGQYKLIYNPKVWGHRGLTEYGNLQFPHDMLNQKGIGGEVIRRYLNAPEYELYHIERDAFETVNLAESIEHKPVLDTFKTQMKNWRHKTADPFMDHQLLTDFANEHHQETKRIKKLTKAKSKDKKALKPKIKLGQRKFVNGKFEPL
jgi:N-sulfoglucosamine sulfohydrolase